MHSPLCSWCCWPGCWQAWQICTIYVVGWRFPYGYPSTHPHWSRSRALYIWISGAYVACLLEPTKAWLACRLLSAWLVTSGPWLVQCCCNERLQDYKQLKLSVIKETLQDRPCHRHLTQLRTKHFHESEKLTVQAVQRADCNATGVADVFAKYMLVMCLLLWRFQCWAVAHMQMAPVQLGTYTHVHVICTTAPQLSHMLPRLVFCIALRLTTKMPCWTPSHNLLWFKAAEILTCVSVLLVAISLMQLIVKSSSPHSAAIFGLNPTSQSSTVQTWPVQWPCSSINIHKRMHAYCSPTRCVRRPEWGSAVDWFLQD